MWFADKDSMVVMPVYFDYQKPREQTLDSVFVTIALDLVKVALKFPDHVDSCEWRDWTCGDDSPTVNSTYNFC